MCHSAGGPWTWPRAPVTWPWSWPGVSVRPERVELRMVELASGHGDVLARHAGQMIAAGGKRLRPLLVCLGAGAPPPESAALVRAAAAVELVHGATLVH